jgi:hypothetical protein
LGHWKNFDELERNLTIEELLKLLDASREKDASQRKFMAQLQGINLEDSKDEVEDVADLKGVHASQAGFGIGLGLGYTMEDEA